MGLLIILAFFAAAAAAASSSSSRPSALSSSGGSPRIAPPPDGSTLSDAAQPDRSAPPATPAPSQPSAWARARAASAADASASGGGTPPSSGRSASSRSRSSSTSTSSSAPTPPALANASPDDAARMITNARTVALAQSMVVAWLNVPTRTGAQVGPFVAALQRARADALAEYALDHWRSPPGQAPSAPQSQGTAPTHTDVSSAGSNAAGHALSLVRSATVQAAQAYLDEWVREPSRTTLDVASAARALQAGGQDALADELLDAWNEHERPDPSA